MTKSTAFTILTILLFFVLLLTPWIVSAVLSLWDDANPFTVSVTAIWGYIIVLLVGLASFFALIRSLGESPKSFRIRSEDEIRKSFFTSLFGIGLIVLVSLIIPLLD